jgi:type IV pilus assembly protein PilX
MKNNKNSFLITKKPSFKSRDLEKGVSLTIVLILLVIISIIGISAVQISSSGTKTVTADRDLRIAWQASEAALMDAEFDILGPNMSPNQRTDVFAAGNRLEFAEGCGNSGIGQGLCLPTTSGKPVWLTANLEANNGSSPAVPFGTFTGRSFDSDGSQSGLRPHFPPRYIIEVVEDKEAFSNASHKVAKKFVYRVTSMGYGPTESITAVTQMVFRK